MNLAELVIDIKGWPLLQQRKQAERGWLYQNWEPAISKRSEIYLSPSKNQQWVPQHRCTTLRKTAHLLLPSMPQALSSALCDHDCVIVYTYLSETCLCMAVIVHWMSPRYIHLICIILLAAICKNNTFCSCYYLVILTPGSKSASNIQPLNYDSWLYLVCSIISPFAVETAFISEIF